MGAADRIADTILRIGQIQGDALTRSADVRAHGAEVAADANARATAANGQIWGQTLASLGQLPGQVIQGLQQQKTQSLENQQRALLNQRAQQVVEGDKAASTLWGSMPKNPDGTMDLSDMSRLALWPKMNTEQQRSFLETASALNQQHAALNQAKVDHAADAADTILQDAKKSGQPLTVAGAALALNWAGQAGIATPETIDKMHQALVAGADPTVLFTAIRNQGSKYKAKPITNETEAAIAAAGGDPVASRAMGMLKPPAQPTEATLAMQAAGGDPTKALGILKPTPKTPAPQTGSFPDYVTRKYGPNPTDAQIIDARKTYGQADDRPTVSVTTQNSDQANVSETVKGMKEGSLPPILPGRATKEYIMLTAEAHRQGYDLSKAATDWAATQKHIATLNGSQQTRLNQSINALPDLLDSVDSLASQWKGSGFPLLNKANMALAKNGAFGSKVASLANQLDSQIADVVADLGNVYMGGNSPTDSALDLSRKSLSADWSEKVLHDMVKLAKGNVQIRKNSIANTGVQGASVDNPYGSQPPAPAAAPSGVIYARDPQGGRHQATAGTPLPPGWKLEQ